MIREQVCWEVTASILIGLVVITVGNWAFGLLGGSFGGFGFVVGALVALAALGYGVFSIVKGLWQLVEAATAEARRPPGGGRLDSTTGTPAAD